MLDVGLCRTSIVIRGLTRESWDRSEESYQREKRSQGRPTRAQASASRGGALSERDEFGKRRTAAIRVVPDLPLRELPGVLWI